jgi:hypothetical protein
MIKVYDNWLNPILQNILEDTFLSNELPWYLPSNKWGTVSPETEEIQLKKDNRVVSSYQMVHPVIIDGVPRQGSTESPLLLYFIESFFVYLNFGGTTIDVYRIKVNLMHRQKCSKKLFFNPPHIDFMIDKPNMNSYVCLYYVNDSDGDTFFFNNNEDLGIIKRVTPKAGRMVLFDNSIYHASSPPQKSNARVVINANLFLPQGAQTLV